MQFFCTQSFLENHQTKPRAMGAQPSVLGSAWDPLWVALPLRRRPGPSELEVNDGDLACLAEERHSFSSSQRMG